MIGVSEMTAIKDWERVDAATAGFIVPPGDGDEVPASPDSRRKARSGNTGGRFLVDEAFLAPGMKIPPHFHANLTEVFYVLEGEILLRVGDQTRTVTAGTFAFSPVRNVHCFSNLSDKPARVLIVAMVHDPNGQTLGALERYFEEMARLMPGAGAPHADAANWEQLAREAGIETVGPPLTSD